MELRHIKLLVVVAHPDDETIGCGGALSRAARSGATCRVLLPLKRGDARGVAHWNELLEQFSAACNLLGAEPIFASDTIVDLRADSHIEEIHKLIEPSVQWADLVLTHHPDDVHQAHQAVSRGVEIATRPFRRRRSVAFFEVLTSTDQAYNYSFSPNLFVGLDEEDVKRKCEAMSLYSTELVTGRTAADLKNHAVIRGRQVALPYAEAFSIARAFL
jgi:LmbE family N-acetylglucosaminyl deacetylase